MHYLYRIINKLNNKVYIGQSNNNRRWSQHKYFARHPEQTGQYIHNSMKKYGVENFEFEIVATCRTQEDADEIESILILQYNSMDKSFGYNLKIGGIGNIKGSHSEETKEKIRKATIQQIADKGHPALGTKRTEEQKANISAALKALDKEAIYTPEVRTNMSLAHIGIKDTEETKENKSLKAKQAWDKRKEEMEAAGELKCGYSECKVVDIPRFYFVNGIKYCSLHAQRLKQTGSFEIIPHVAHNKGKKISEETRVKLMGRVPHNRINFTEEQISSIMMDTRSAKKIAKDFKVTEKVILRIIKENK